MYALQADYEDDIEVLQINIDEPESAELMQQYGFRSKTPHLLLYDANGKLVRQWFGTFEREQVEGLFSDIFN